MKARIILLASVVLALAVAPTMVQGGVDGDGNLDAVFANSAVSNRVCQGDGAGGFTCADVSTDTNTSRGVALAPGAPPFSKDTASCQKTLGKTKKNVTSKVIQAHSQCLDADATGKKPCDTTKRDDRIAKAVAQAEKQLDKKCSLGDYIQLGFPVNTTAPAIRDALVEGAQDAAQDQIRDVYTANYANKP